MKKFTILVLSLICLSFNMLIATAVDAATVTVLNEGVYKVADLKFSPDNIYTVENTSPNNSITVFVFDKNEVIQQSIRLEPQSSKYNLIPLATDYKITIVGKGEALISSS